MLDAPDEELSPRISLWPELHHERPLRRKGHFCPCTGTVLRLLVFHAEPYTPQFLRGPEKTLRLAVNRGFCVPHGPVVIEFPPFQLDVRGWQLRRDGKPVPLRPKTFAFLQYLAERPGELVTKQALLDAVWPGVAVTLASTLRLPPPCRRFPYGGLHQVGSCGCPCSARSRC